ncbi:MAG: tRNA (adenosine(37)-N6)-threonylcarbamoyltransferase complex ATPase subunit type 1 TsaE [Bacteroidota bacterium]|nr:tRNA (adenosine(37)-N6)-threonylcarbamoyltransferase complex ATPase subunit type 1 TsaE [Bacteroidota bacterium]
MEIIYTLNEIEGVARKLISLIKSYKVFTFSGELGAGKTTLITAICRELGVQESVSSPTYSIIQEYELPGSSVIYHLDLYRIKNVQEAIDAGVEDCLLTGELCFVEWPEMASEIFPEEIVHVTLQAISSGKRKLVAQFP